jgi:hypothetical protein
VKVLCSVFLLSRQAYYQWLRKQRELTLHGQQEISLCKSITAIYTQHRMVYGSRKVHCTLREHGVRVGRNRVARIMQEQGLFGIRKPRNFKNASHSTPSKMLKNELNRQFYPTKPNTVWLTDFTQVRVKGGSDLFLAVVLDMFSRCGRLGNPSDARKSSTAGNPSCGRTPNAEAGRPTPQRSWQRVHVSRNATLHAEMRHQTELQSHWQLLG